MCGAPLAAEREAREERKVVSVLFCDLVGFTAASERADPEDVRARLRPYHAQLQQVIESHGGTVEKFVGDAVMAVFGAPVAHEDDAERAVRAGLRILEAIEDLNRSDEKLQLQVRVGINTGEAVVALGAHPERGEGFVTGDVVNTASRLQGVAPVNGVAVSEATFRHTERVFSFVRLEPVTVKGKAEPLLVWQPLAARARFGPDVIRASATPLVGRELERPLLRRLAERPPVASGETRLVDRMSSIRFGSARYSVPSNLRGQVVQVMVDGDEVRIIHDGGEVAFHKLQQPGGASILDEHYPTPPRHGLRAVRPRTPVEQAFLELGPPAVHFC
jgi:class 3 adenylate cyclase